MKARIKSTGEIKDVIAGDIYLEGMGGRSLGINEVEFEGCFDKTDWDTLRNQAAIAAMQGLLSNEMYSSNSAKKAKEESEDAPNVFLKTISKDAVEIADALVLEIIQKTSLANRISNKMDELVRKIKKWNKNK